MSESISKKATSPIRRCKAVYRSMRMDSRWKSLKLTVAKTTIGGLLSDFLSPWLNIIGWAFPISIALAMCSSGIWIFCKRKANPIPSCAQKSASVALVGIVGILVLCPIFFMNVLASKDDKGAVASLVPAIDKLQAMLTGRFDAVEAKLERQTSVSEAMRKTMDYATAFSVLDRAVQARDGSSQGQGVAIETLASLGHSYIGSNFSGVSFELAHLPKINFSNAVLHFSKFTGADLSGSTMSATGLRFANMDRADLSSVDLSDAFAPFLSGRGSNLRGANLRQANFFGADLRDADLRGADLTSAALPFADLRGADLRGAKLKAAYLSGANLLGAKLSNAVFDNTDMLAAKYSNSDMTADQQAKICRHSPDSGNRIQIELIEKWPSDRFASGYEFEVLNRFESFFYMDDLLKKDLSPCEASEAKPAGFSGIGYIRLHLDRFYLDKAGRYALIGEKMKRMLEIFRNQ